MAPLRAALEHDPADVVCIVHAEAAISKYGLAFIGHTTWIPAANEFGAWPFISIANRTLQCP